jgi:hypothetical protein
MSINTNVRMVKEEYIAGYEEIYRDVNKTRQIESKELAYRFNKTYTLPNDIVIKVNDLMQNKKVEYYLWRYYDFFETNLEIENLSKNLDYEHVCFCFEDLPHIESILINNIWRLGKEWSHTIICCEDNYSFISSFINKTNANIRVIKLDSDIVCIHEINDYLLNKDFLNKFHGKYLFFSNVSSLITNNIKISDFNNIHYANTGIHGFSFCNKDRLTEQIFKIGEKNKNYKNTPEYYENKKTYDLETIPANIFYTSVLESELINNEYLKNKMIDIYNFSHLSCLDKNETFTKIVKYLEELLSIYY